MNDSRSNPGNQIGKQSAAAPSPLGSRWRQQMSWAGLVLALAVFVALLIWWFLRGVEVKAVSPARGNAAEVVYATGIVEPAHWAKVASLQRKRIVELCQCEGRAVRKGDVLARLDDVEERAVLAELEARLKRFREDSERLKTLLDKNATTRTAYEDKITQLREYESRVAAQRDRIADLELKSPMDGIVLRRDGEVGEIAGINANDVLMWVGQPKPLRVVSEISEDDIVKVKAGQKVLLRHEGLVGRTIEATVDSVTPKGDPQTKTFRAYLALPEDSPLQIGMSIEANIVVREVIDSLLVPAEAISDGKVLVLIGGRVRRVPVAIGLRGTRMVEVTKGVTATDRIISPFRNDLRDGARVRMTGTTP